MNWFEEVNWFRIAIHTYVHGKLMFYEPIQLGSNLMTCTTLLHASVEYRDWTHGLQVTALQPYQLNYNCPGSIAHGVKTIFHHWRLCLSCKITLLWCEFCMPIFKDFLVFPEQTQTKHRVEENEKGIPWRNVTYEFNKGLVTIGANVALRVDDSTKGSTNLDKLFFAAFPRQITQVEDLWRRLGIPELALHRWRGCSGGVHGSSESNKQTDRQRSDWRKKKKKKSCYSSWNMKKIRNRFKLSGSQRVRDRDR